MRWRFSDAGPGARGEARVGRHPKTCTWAEMLKASICGRLYGQEADDMMHRSILTLRAITGREQLQQILTPEAA